MTPLKSHLFSKNNIPNLLLYGRLLLAFAFPIIAYGFGPSASIIIAILVLIGFLADIFDGIIARYLGVSTENLRLADSIIDRIYWLLVFWTCYLLYPDYVVANFPLVAVVFGLDLLVYILSIIRFGKIPSPHNLLTKLWGITIALSFIELILVGDSILPMMMVIIGIISRIDSFLIYAILNKWAHDIPSCLHAIQINQGKTIKRHKLFNG